MCDEMDNLQRSCVIHFVQNLNYSLDYGVVVVAAVVDVSIRGVVLPEPIAGVVELVSMSGALDGAGAGKLPLLPLVD